MSSNISTTEFNPDNFLQAVTSLPSQLLQTNSVQDRHYYVKFKFRDQLKWTALCSDNYNDIKTTACSCFPELLQIEFEIADVEGAVIDSNFIANFLNISPHGVILNLIPIARPNLELLTSTPPTEKNSDVSVFSTFSKAYTHGENSCSTETVGYLLSSSPSPSTSTCTNFDEDDVSVDSPSRKRLNTAAFPYNKLKHQELKNYLLSHPGGKEIINFYKERKTLDDPNRKKLVNIIVDHMLQPLPPNLLPCTETKIEYAKAIVTLFPKLRDRNTTEGYEAFFDPITKKGFFTTRLRNLFRDKQNKLTYAASSHASSSNTTLDEINESNIDDKISFLKAATSEQIEDIFNITKETFAFRNRNRQNLAREFPRFLDTNGLISFEFSLMHPGKGGNFERNFPKYIPVIKEVYKSTVTSPNNRLLSETNDDDDWNSTTRALIILIHLLPSCSSKSARKTAASRAVEQLLVFRDMQLPLTGILEEKPSTQPFILAVGTSKTAISKYYTVFDNNIVPSPTQEIISAFDLCFKIHFVFNLHFNKTLEHFFKFVQYTFYDLPVDSITNRIRELRTKFDNVIAEESEST